MKDHDRDGAMAAVAALGDPLRRRLYHFVSAQEGAVSRDAAAEGVGVTRAAAAFHLDRLVEDGLLEAEFRRLTGRQGPGAGRPAKLYRRARREISVSLPARRYDLAAGLLAAAITAAAESGEPVRATLHRLARERGAALAASATLGPGRGETRAAWAQAAAEALAGQGYEPRVGSGDIVLANCPFHALAGEYRDLVCQMNLALLQGFAEALSPGAITARLEPEEGACCVRLTLRTA